MADTIRTKAAILALMADNKSGNISPQDMRDAIVTIYDAIENASLLGPYMYIAYALDANGTGFTTSINPAYNFIAIKQSQTEILVLQQSDFAGLWVQYKNQTPIVGQNVYIAYADDAIGTGFTTVFNPAKEYIGIIASPTPLTPVVGDFLGYWKNYTGNSEFGLLTQSFSRNWGYVTDQYLRVEDGSPSNISPVTMYWDGTIRAIGMNNQGTHTWTAEVHVNGVLLPGATLTVTAGNSNYNNLFVGLDVNAGDKISVYMIGTGIEYPKVDLSIRRR